MFPHLRAQTMAFIACLLTLGLLSGCAMPRLIDSDVQSFTASAAAVTPASYRFERLPSQAGAPVPSTLETLAAQSLSKVGLVAVPAGAEVTARYAVQVSLEVSRIASPYPQSSMGGGWWGHRDGRRRLLLDMSLEPQWVRHVVRVLLRDTASAQVAYETSATFDGPWSDTNNLLPALLDAALQGYPHPPAGPRKVVIELPAPEAQDD